MLPGLEFTENDSFWHARVFHSRDVPRPAKLLLDGLDAGELGLLKNIFIGHVVVPLDV